MAFSFCLSHHQLALKINLLTSVAKHPTPAFAFKAVNNELYGLGIGYSLRTEWSFAGGSRGIVRPNLGRSDMRQKNLRLQASWLASSQLAGDAFTLGTAAVLPFYTLMVAAPKADLVRVNEVVLARAHINNSSTLWGRNKTRKCMRSSIPYVVLGVLYTYLLYLSWTPDTIRLMFSSKYWLPELPGIAKMFSKETTLASAWIHLLAVDLYAARQVYQDGLDNDIETRHSVSLCLLFCPIGILIHAITKALITTSRGSKTEIH